MAVKRRENLKIAVPLKGGARIPVCVTLGHCLQISQLKQQVDEGGRHLRNTNQQVCVWREKPVPPGAPGYLTDFQQSRL